MRAAAPRLPTNPAPPASDLGARMLTQVLSDVSVRTHEVIS